MDKDEETAVTAQNQENAEKKTKKKVKKKKKVKAKKKKLKKEIVETEPGSTVSGGSNVKDDSGEDSNEDAKPSSDQPPTQSSTSSTATEVSAPPSAPAEEPSAAPVTNTTTTPNTSTTPEPVTNETSQTQPPSEQKAEEPQSEQKPSSSQDDAKATPTGEEDTVDKSQNTTSSGAKKYKKISKRICAQCSQYIPKELEVLALGKRFHKTCFCCAGCRQHITAEFTSLDGLPYCVSCDARMKLGNCSLCKLPITSVGGASGSGEFVDVNDQRFHIECFRCGNCKQAIDSSQDFIERDDGVFLCAACGATPCAGCGKNLGDEYVRFADGLWHRQCLVCAQCSEQLSVQSGFTHHEGRNLCTKCFNIACPPKASVTVTEEKVPKEKCCSLCHAELEIENSSGDKNFVEVPGGKYHPQCFVCEHCYARLDPLLYVTTEDGKHICNDCNSPCTGCGKPLLSQDLEAFGGRWHRQCFCCAHCATALSYYYHEWQGKAYCEQCLLTVAKRGANDACAGCQEPLNLTGKSAQDVNAIVAMNKSWHRHCFKCEKCGMPLAESFFKIDGRPYCVVCCDEIEEKLPRCGRCQKRIFEDQQSLKALGKLWHRNCWSCFDCKTLLPAPESASASSASSLFNEKVGQPYCGVCYAELQKNICSACGLFLDGQRMNVGGKKYHVACYICHRCKGSLAGGCRFVEEQLYCGPCSQAVRAEGTCAGCNKTISGDRRFAALGKRWHRDCFRCGQCKALLGGSSDSSGGDEEFKTKNDVPYCAKCYVPESRTIESGECCAGCSKPFGADKRFSALGKKFHAQCFVCCGCKTKLEGGYIEIVGQAYCSECARKAKDDLCAICKQKLSGSGGKVFSMGGRKFHGDCLKCQGCGKKLEGSLLEKDGKFHCGCLSVESCAGCRQGLQTGTRIFAIGKKWHKDCFKCSKCKGSLADGFFNVNEAPVCGTCAKKK